MLDSKNWEVSHILQTQLQIQQHLHKDIDQTKSADKTKEGISKQIHYIVTNNNNNKALSNYMKLVHESQDIIKLGYRLKLQQHYYNFKPPNYLKPVSLFDN